MGNTAVHLGNIVRSSILVWISPISQSGFRDVEFKFGNTNYLQIHVLVSNQFVFHHVIHLRVHDEHGYTSSAYDCMYSMTCYVTFIDEAY